ncbi:NAD(P)-dependent alcohol dehydrogenase [Nocardioides sp.]|uniref:NAD(P)-dependent alcohol dehydrogenase n=1 Tax=Nocardioides sp. TaxID=35761 RepID=UPI003517948A
MPTLVPALSVPSAGAPFERIELTRRDLRPDDVRIAIRYAGICHSDIHQVRQEWGRTTYPITPGHEIVGEVVEVGSEVTRHAVGDRVGVGCFVDACLECAACKDGEEQFCERGVVGTYAATGYDGERTQGGYSGQIVVRDHFVVRIPDAFSDDQLAAVTPLLCAGITTYSPLKRFNVGPGTRVGVIGLGGLGHVGVKIAAAMGARVTVFSRTDSKAADGLAMGATDHVATAEKGALRAKANSYDLLLNTVGDGIDLNGHLATLDRGGVMINVGAPSDQLSFGAFSLIGFRRQMVGSLVGGLPETQEMLDFCAEHGITATVEVIGADDVDAYYDKIVAGDVRYRAVIDTATFSG